MWYWAQQPYLPQALEPVQEAAQAAELSREVLPPPHKDVIYLYYYEEYSAEEIGQILGKNTNTVYTLLTRARKMLKTRLEGVTENG